MRKMFILRGAHGSGKNTLIHALGVEHKVLSYDNAREALFGTRSYAFGGETMAISRNADRLAREATHAAADDRMHNGDTLFINNVNLSMRDIIPWTALARTHEYKVFVVNMQGDLTDEVLLERNAQRPMFDQVDETILLKAADRYRSSNLSDDLNVIDVRYDNVIERVREELTVRTTHLDNEYDRVVVVGDLQGCGEALERLLNEVPGGLDDQSTLWVFVGDLFDRGPTPTKVYEILSRPRRNVVLVEGNHERSVRETLNEYRLYKASAETVSLVMEGHSRKGLRNLINRGVPFFPFTFAGKHRWVSHGGISPERVQSIRVSEDEYQAGMIPNRDFMIGTGHRSEVYRNIGSYGNFSERLEAETVDSDIVDVQYFGHRNDNREKGPLDYEGVRLLESAVEEGGVLTAVVISKDGSEKVVQVEGE